MDLKPSLYGFDEAEMNQLVKDLKTPAYRAKQLLEWLFKKHIEKWEEAQNLPDDFRKILSEKVSLFTLKLESAKESTNRESIKFLFQTHEGRILETVLISQMGRKTVCVSTQLGCKMGCLFCASGKGKFGRNLTAGEIIEQVAWVERYIKGKISNIVYMGMGEPLDNFDATMKSLRILHSQWGFALGARRITVSTSGITPKILEFVKLCEGKVRLSVSLHSSIEKTRSELVPINKKYSLKELEETLIHVNRTLKRDVTFEYTLIDGVNDSKEEALGVARLANMINAKINVIPYNPISEMDFKTPTQENIKRFKDILQKKGICVMIRQTAGRDINAACGQLRLDREKELSKP